MLRRSKVELTVDADIGKMKDSINSQYSSAFDDITNEYERKEVVVKARGRAISRAVDAVELLRRAFVKNVEVANIVIGTEEIRREDGSKSNVSTMEITLTKKD